MDKYKVIVREHSYEVEAEDEEKAKQTAEEVDWNKVEVEKILNKEERYCVKCGKTSDLIEEEDMCYTCAKERGRV